MRKNDKGRFVKTVCTASTEASSHTKNLLTFWGITIFADPWLLFPLTLVDLYICVCVSGRISLAMPSILFVDTVCGEVACYECVLLFVLYGFYISTANCGLYISTLSCFGLEHPVRYNLGLWKKNNAVMNKKNSQHPMSFHSTNRSHLYSSVYVFMLNFFVKFFELSSKRGKALYYYFF